MDVLREARAILLEEAEGFRDSASCRGVYQGDEETTRIIEKYETVAAGLYAVMLALGMK